MDHQPTARPLTGAPITLFLSGDVMTARGIDQILPSPSAPTLYESFVTSALEYVELAEQASGEIPRPVDFSYIWGDALAELEARAPHLRVINLETSITTSEDAEPKGINYRMNPRNVPCLTAAGIDCCVLANNHVLDWGYAGLLQSLRTLQEAGIASTGAGRNAKEACRPAALSLRGDRRLLVFALGSPSSGVTHRWAADESRAGVCFLPDLSPGAVEKIVRHIQEHRRPGDVVLVSIHWGANWGYEIPKAQREFAHRLIDSGCVDVLYGHSSHHPKGIECYRGRLILYGCGDFLNDYEGISGYEEFRSELALAYFVTLDATGRLNRLTMAPFKIRRFRLERVAAGDAEWLRTVLDRESKALGAEVRLDIDGALSLTCRHD